MGVAWSVYSLHIEAGASRRAQVQPLPSTAVPWAAQPMALSSCFCLFLSHPAPKVSAPSEQWGQKQIALTSGREWAVTEKVEVFLLGGPAALFSGSQKSHSSRAGEQGPGCSSLPAADGVVPALTAFLIHLHIRADCSGREDAEGVRALHPPPR